MMVNPGGMGHDPRADAEDAKEGLGASDGPLSFIATAKKEPAAVRSGPARAPPVRHLDDAYAAAPDVGGHIGTCAGSGFTSCSTSDRRRHVRCTVRRHDQVEDAESSGVRRGGRAEWASITAAQRLLARTPRAPHLSKRPGTNLFVRAA
jgi:hypothetical protein